MTYEVEVGGRRRTIEVRRAARDWEVTLDGRTMPVSVTAVEGLWSLLIGPPDSGVGACRRPMPMRPMKSYEFSIEERGNGQQIVHVRGLAVPVSILDPRTRLARGPRAVARAETGARPIVAPMPGRIVRVLVKVGDVVAAHQGLVVVEAMKMENELRAPTAGRVTDVRVRDGMSVDANSVLIVMDSAS